MVIGGIPPLDSMGGKITAGRNGFPAKEVEDHMNELWQLRWKESDKSDKDV